MPYGPHHQPLKAIDLAGNIATFAVFATTITAATLGALDLLALPQLAWNLIFAVLPWIQSRSIREYDEAARPYIKSVSHMAILGTSFVAQPLSHFLFEGGEQASDPILRASCWVLIGAFPILNAIISGYCTAIADLILDDRTLPWLKKKPQTEEKRE